MASGLGSQPTGMNSPGIPKLILNWDRELAGLFETANFGPKLVHTSSLTNAHSSMFHYFLLVVEKNVVASPGIGGISSVLLGVCRLPLWVRNHPMKERKTPATFVLPSFFSFYFIYLTII